MIDLAALLKTSKHPGFVQTGAVCGFPACCIKEFCEDFRSKPRRKLHGTGYVPCISCNKKTRAELKAAIAILRDPMLLPFPNDIGLIAIVKGIMSGQKTG